MLALEAVLADINWAMKQVSQAPNFFSPNVGSAEWGKVKTELRPYIFNERDQLSGECWSQHETWTNQHMDKFLFPWSWMQEIEAQDGTSVYWNLKAKQI